MLNNASLHAVAEARIDDNLGRPLFGSYCFAGIPELVRSLLVDGSAKGLPADVLPEPSERYDQVILILLDGFGWSFFDRHVASLPFFRRIVEEGVASKLTTQFPSTTAAHVTTLHAGIDVGQSGIFEWFYYEPVLDRIFSPLTHCTVEPDGVTPLSPSDAPLYPSRTLYETLADHGVSSTCAQNRRYASSPFSTAVCRGARKSPYSTLPEALVNVAEAARATSGPAYHCLYVDTIDAISHRYGPDSAQLNAEIVGIGQMLESILQPRLAELPSRTLVLLTADHGHTAIDPKTTIYLDQLLPGCAKWMRTDGQGHPLVPGGSSRDMFLYIEPEAFDEADSRLSAALEGSARVMRTADMLRDGFFGPQPSSRLRERLGELLVLPHQGQTVWWNGDGRFTEHKQGHHGGLRAEEMEIPLLAQVYGG